MINTTQRINNLRRALARTDDTNTRATLRAALVQAEAAQNARHTKYNATPSPYSRVLVASASRGGL